MVFVIFYFLYKNGGFMDSGCPYINLYINGGFMDLYVDCCMDLWCNCLIDAGSHCLRFHEFCCALGERV